MKLFRALLAITLLLAVSSARAQEKAPPPPPPPPQTSLNVPVKVQVVFTEFEGEKKISSLPYVLHTISEPGNPGPSSLRMGIRVPITTMGKESQVQYQNVGTDVDCWVTSFADGTFRLRLSLRRSSVYAPGQDGKQVEWKPGEPFMTGTPLLREFSGNVSLSMRDGQVSQATVATDPVSARTLKVDVTLNVVK